MGFSARPRPSRAFSGRAILDFGQPQSWFRRMQPSATLARCVRPFTWTCLGPRGRVMTPALVSHPALGWRVVPFFVGFRHGRPFVGMAPKQPACRVYVATTGGLLVTGGRQTNAPATTFYRNSRILFTTLSYEVGYIRRTASMCSSSTFMSALYWTPLQASRNSEP